MVPLSPPARRAFSSRRSESAALQECLPRRGAGKNAHAPDHGNEGGARWRVADVEIQTVVRRSGNMGTGLLFELSVAGTRWVKIPARNLQEIVICGTILLPLEKQ